MVGDVADRGPRGADLQLRGRPSSDMLPKLSEATLVTVPDDAAYSAPCAVSASVSQDQPTSPSSGSLAISGSISARA